MKVYRIAPFNDEKIQLVMEDLIPDVIPEEKKPLDNPRDEIEWDDEDG